MTHFCYDGYGIEQERLTDFATLDCFVQHLRDLISTNVSGQLFRTVDCIGFGNPQLTGVSCVGLSRNSHLTVHTFDKAKAAFFDYYGHARIFQDLITRELNHFFLPGQVMLSLTDEMDCGCGDFNNFGQHLFYRRPELCFSEAQELVEDIINEIGMTRLGSALELYSDESKSEYDYLQPIAESHIAIHSYEGETAIDVFSCKPYNVEAVTELIGVPPSAQIPRGVLLSKAWLKSIG